MFKQDCFSDKRFLITGASSGLGAAIALELNALGAEVVALARDSKKLESKREKALYKERFIPISKDISEYVSLDKWALNLAKEYGSFDGAVLSVENATAIFNVNYFGNLQILKGLLDKRAKSADKASFVWISSNASVKAQKGLSSYSATKAGGECRG
ncbi:SDR family NAD(P)-dependent oxidoreductase [Helicobacter bilis]|uniref:SDR family NAD(P)-dependent oxidoreductase n=1 Tax=Helicobacter bilis TaxID=37372 RepID=UPI000B3095FE|nr:SDR family oxidoreductase [Helicobacter bilis]